jgi:hypothetical protein
LVGFLRIYSCNRVLSLGASVLSLGHAQHSGVYLGLLHGLAWPETVSLWTSAHATSAIYATTLSARLPALPLPVNYIAPCLTLSSPPRQKWGMNPPKMGHESASGDVAPPPAPALEGYS